MIRFFLSGTSTGIGKTTIGRALLFAARAFGFYPLGLKPIETGATPSDAHDLATASTPPPPVPTPGFYRALDPLSPHAVFLRTGCAPPSPKILANAIRAATQPLHDFVLVEGAGGLLVPLAPQLTLADVARALDWPVLLIAPNRLGVLSDVLCTYEAAAARSLEVRAIVLNCFGTDPEDESPRDNADVLRQHLPIPVHEFRSNDLRPTSLKNAGISLLQALQPSLHTERPSL